MKINAQELTPENFFAYGQVIEIPSRQTDASGPGWQWWGELVKMEGGDRPYAIGYLDLKPASLNFDWTERHMHSDELLVPLNGDCLVYVAPPDYPDQPDRMPDFSAFEAFIVRCGQAVLLKQGVWHGAPMAIVDPLNVLVILLYHSGKQDVYIQRFEQSPLEIALPA